MQITRSQYYLIWGNRTAPEYVTKVLGSPHRALIEAETPHAGRVVSGNTLCEMGITELPTQAEIAREKGENHGKVKP
jgi:hypothetical protein